MAKERSLCGNMGHSSRMCQTENKSTSVSRGFKLFGVHLETSSLATPAMRKSGNVEYFSPSSSLPSLKFSDVYHSDDLQRHTRQRKTGVSWTEDEHRKFLAGLEKLGKGDWKGISKLFVQSRTPTQVASHAQKYFLKQNILNKKREMPSQFSMQSENIERSNLNATRSSYDPTSDISENLCLRYANLYYTEAILRKSSYLQSPVTSPLVSSWFYSSNGMSIIPKCNYYLNPAIVESEPDLELALAVPAPKHRD